MFTDPQLKSKVDALWDHLWSGEMANPITAIKQMSYLIFLKRLEDMDIPREVAEKAKTNATIDWTIREIARAKLMVVVRRTLIKYGYPPDKQQKATDTVLKQAELMAEFIVDA